MRRSSRPGRTVVLDELQFEGAVVDLSDAAAGALATSRLVEVRPDRTGWRLVPTGRVGSVLIDDLQVDVRPKAKVGLTRLLFLMGYARDPGWRPELVHAHQQDDLWPALAESLDQTTRIALGPGVLQGYRTRDEALNLVRGRIRMGDQITWRPGRMVPIEVTFDEFTVDIAENRILRAALRRMLGVPRLSDPVRAGLAHLDGQLAGVSLLTPGAPLPAWQPDRRNERYTHALRLAEIVLANCSAEAGPEGLRMASFVVTMSAVYEDFLARALEEALRSYPGETQSQHRVSLDLPEVGARPAIAMEIDVVHLVPGHSALVFDAKYKAASATGAYPNADHYQMLAYCTALKAPTAWLVYANGPRGRRRIVNSDITVMEHSLDLSAEPAELLKQVDSLAAAAWREAAARGGRAPHPPRRAGVAPWVKGARSA